MRSEYFRCVVETSLVGCVDLARKSFGVGMQIGICFHVFPVKFRFELVIWACMWIDYDSRSHFVGLETFSSTFEQWLLWQWTICVSG